MVFGEDLVGGLGPGEWVAALVPAVDEGADLGVEVLDGGEDSSADGRTVDDGEEDLDHVEPGGAGGGEVDVDARVGLQPGAHLEVFPPTLSSQLTELVGHIHRVMNACLELVNIGDDRVHLDVNATLAFNAKPWQDLVSFCLENRDANLRKILGNAGMTMLPRRPIPKGGFWVIPLPKADGTDGDGES